MALEKNVQDAVIRYLVKVGAWYTKIHQSGRGRRGVPDILACYKGIFIAIEVKGEGGTLRDEQRTELRGVKDAGGVAVVAYAVEDVQRVVRRIDEHPDEYGTMFAVSELSSPIPPRRSVKL